MLTLQSQLQESRRECGKLEAALGQCEMQLDHLAKKRQTVGEEKEEGDDFGAVIVNRVDQSDPITVALFDEDVLSFRGPHHLRCFSLFE